jgi:hypothetical protein
VTRTAVAGVAAVSLALVGIFVALAVSVVDARRPLDANVSKSFDAAISKRVGGSAVADPRGCIKTRVSVYRCSAILRPPRAREITVYWNLWLRGDECWRLVRAAPYTGASTLALAKVGLTSITGCNS